MRLSSLLTLLFTVFFPLAALGGVIPSRKDDRKNLATFSNAWTPEQWQQYMADHTRSLKLKYTQHNHVLLELPLERLGQDSERILVYEPWQWEVDDQPYKSLSEDEQHDAIYRELVQEAMALAVEHPELDIEVPYPWNSELQHETDGGYVEVAEIVDPCQ